MYKVYVMLICAVIMLAATVANIQHHIYVNALMTGAMCILDIIAAVLVKKYYKPLKDKS